MKKKSCWFISTPASVYDAIIVGRNVIWHPDRLGAEMFARENGWIVTNNAFHVHLWSRKIWFDQTDESKLCNQLNWNQWFRSWADLINCWRNLLHVGTAPGRGMRGAFVKGAEISNWKRQEARERANDPQWRSNNQLTWRINRAGRTRVKSIRESKTLPSLFSWASKQSAKSE